MGAVGTRRSNCEDLQKDIAILSEMMQTCHYFPEASWLRSAMERPWLCQSIGAQKSLRHAAQIAWEFGFPAVARWLRQEILEVSAPETGTPAR